jgi:hypothetical protein
MSAARPSLASAVGGKDAATAIGNSSAAAIGNASAGGVRGGNHTEPPPPALPLSAGAAAVIGTCLPCASLHASTGLHTTDRCIAMLRRLRFALRQYSLLSLVGDEPPPLPPAVFFQCQSASTGPEFAHGAECCARTMPMVCAADPKLRNTSRMLSDATDDFVSFERKAGEEWSNCTLNCTGTPLYNCTEAEGGCDDGASSRNTTNSSDSSNSIPVSGALCDPGQWSEDGHMSRRCKSCASGQYQDSVGQDSCKTCPIGQYQRSAGMSRCLSAPKGALATTVHAGNASTGHSKAHLSGTTSAHGTLLPTAAPTAAPQTNSPTPTPPTPLPPEGLLKIWYLAAGKRCPTDATSPPPSASALLILPRGQPIRLHPCNAQSMSKFAAMMKLPQGLRLNT